MQEFNQNNEKELDQVKARIEKLETQTKQIKRGCLVFLISTQLFIVTFTIIRYIIPSIFR